MYTDLPPQQVECVARAIYGEARAEIKKGQLAVGHVVMNRSKARKITPCQVIYQKNQFHFIKARISYSGAAWDRAVQLAKNLGSDPTGGAQYFHNKSVRPGWGKRLVAVIGNHLFYK